MSQTLPKRKMYRYCLADIAKGLFNGMIGNYLLYFFQPTETSGLPVLLPQNKLLGFVTVMALLTGIGKMIDAVTDPLVASLSDKCTHKDGRRMPFLRYAAIPYALSVLLIFYAPFQTGSIANAVWVGFFLFTYYTAYTFFFVPRNALVPEIIPDTKVRVGYYGISTAFFMGSSSFMYAATLFVNLLEKAGLSPLMAWRTVFTGFALIGVICLLLSAYAFNEKDYVQDNNKPKDSLMKSFALVFRKKICNFQYWRPVQRRFHGILSNSDAVLHHHAPACSGIPVLPGDAYGHCDCTLSVSDDCKAQSKTQQKASPCGSQCGVYPGLCLDLFWRQNSGACSGA